MTTLDGTGDQIRTAQNDNNRTVSCFQERCRRVTVYLFQVGQRAADIHYGKVGSSEVKEKIIGLHGSDASHWMPLPAGPENSAKGAT